jgi:hypothetical protein
MLSTLRLPGLKAWRRRMGQPQKGDFWVTKSLEENLCNPVSKSLPVGPLPTGRQAVPTEGGAGTWVIKRPIGCLLEL